MIIISGTIAIRKRVATKSYFDGPKTKIYNCSQCEQLYKLASEQFVSNVNFHFLSLKICLSTIMVAKGL